MLRTGASHGRPSVTSRQVLPKSVVRAKCGAKSPARCASKATNAVPRDAALATMRPTYVPLAICAPPPGCDHRAQLLPRLAAVDRELDVAVVGADPEDF